MGFLKTNDDKIINLRNVTSIGFLDKKFRIVFNLNHSIEINDRDSGRVIMSADYKYMDFDSELEYKAVTKSIEQMSILDGFLVSPQKNHYLVNPSNVSYINFDQHNNRIIFNLNVSVTKKSTGLLTNDYVFWTFSDFDSYLKASIQVNEELLP